MQLTVIARQRRWWTCGVTVIWVVACLKQQAFVVSFCCCCWSCHDKTKRFSCKCMLCIYLDQYSICLPFSSFRIISASTPSSSSFCLQHLLHGFAKNLYLPLSLLQFGLEYIDFLVFVLQIVIIRILFLC